MEMDKFNFEIPELLRGPVRAPRTPAELEADRAEQAARDAKLARIEARKAAEAAREHAAWRAKRLDEAGETGVPLTAEARALVVNEEYEDTPAIKAVRAWDQSNHSRPILVLCGPTRVGKTVAAAAAIAQHRGSRYVKSKRLVGLAAAQYGEDRER